MKDNWRVLPYCFTGIVIYTSPLTRRFNGRRVTGGMPTVCETNWHTSRSCRLSTGEWLQSSFHDDWLPQRRRKLRPDMRRNRLKFHRVCPAEVARDTCVFASLLEEILFLFFHHSYRKEMLLRRYITTTYGKQRNHLLNSRFFFWTVRSLVRLVSIHLADFRFSSSAEVGFFPFFLKNVVILFFFPSNPKGASYFISLSSFLVFPDWQVWCCLSMMVTCCWLLPRPQTRQLDFVVHPYACTYVHLFFPLRFSLVNSCVYIVPPKTPCPAIGHHGWRNMMAVARVASHNSSSQELFWGIGGYELVASRQNTYWQRATSQLLRQNNKSERYQEQSFKCMPVSFAQQLLGTVFAYILKYHLFVDVGKNRKTDFEVYWLDLSYSQVANSLLSWVISRAYSIRLSGCFRR